MQDRYINNALWCRVQRPQPYRQCSLSSLAAVITYLLGQVHTTSYIQNILGWTKECMEQGRVSNEMMIAGLSHFGLIGSVLHQPSWETIVQLINEQRPLILHRKGHYCVVIGYWHEPTNKKWIVIGEHRVKGRTSAELGMLESISWSELMREFHGRPNLGFILAQLDS